MRLRTGRLFPTREGQTNLTGKIQTLLVALIVPATLGVLYVGVPMLTSGMPIVSDQAGRHVETARRMIRKYGVNEERLSDLLAQLADWGESPALDSDRINALLEGDRTILAPAEEHLKSLAKSGNVGAQRELESRFEAMGGQRDGSLTPQSSFGANVGQMAGVIRDAIRQRDQLIGENDKLLASAIAELEAAGNVSSGDATGRDFFATSRLKGAVQLVQATRSLRKAHLLRLRADEHREELVNLASQAAKLKIDTDLVNAGGVLRNVEQLRTQSLQLQKTIDDSEADLRQLTGTIGDLEARVAGFRDRARQARDTMDKLETDGVDMTDPNGSQVFADTYAAAASQYREAASNAHRLEHGTLTNARIDESMNFVTGQYQPADAGSDIKVQRGLIDYQHDRETTAVELEGLKAALVSVRESITQLQETADAHAATSANARKKLTDIQATASESFKTYETTIVEADKSLDDATRIARQAGQSLSASATTADQWTRDASDRIATASPEAMGRSAFKLQADDRWLAAQIRNESAQAELLVGRALVNKFELSREAGGLFAKVGDMLSLSPTDAGALAGRQSALREEATDALRKSVNSFERTSRELNKSWTIAAQLGGVHYLLSLVENTDHADTAILNYQAAVDGRESKPFVAPFAARLKYLRQK